MNNLHLAVQFFIQFAVILLFCRLVGAIALRLGQPQVVAEMVAGVSSRTIAFWFALAGCTALAFSVGPRSENARHLKLFVSGVTTRARALYVCGWNGIPRRHRALKIDKHNRRVGRGNADTFRIGRRPGLDSI